MTADERDGLIQVFRVLADLAIGPPEVLAPRGAQDGAGGLRLREPLVHGAVAAHLAGGEVAQSHAQAPRSVVCDRAAQPDLQIVGMRPERQQVDSHQRVNSNARSDESVSPRWCRSMMRLARYAQVTLWLESPNAKS